MSTEYFEYQLNHIFDNYGEASAVLTRLRDVIRMTGRVAVSEFYACIGYPENTRVNKFLWKDLNAARIEEININCWKLILPQPEYYRSGY